MPTTSQLRRHHRDRSCGPLVTLAATTLFIQSLWNNRRILDLALNEEEAPANASLRDVAAKYDIEISPTQKRRRPATRPRAKYGREHQNDGMPTAVEGELSQDGSLGLVFPVLDNSLFTFLERATSSLYAAREYDRFLDYVCLQTIERTTAPSGSHIAVSPKDIRSSSLGEDASGPIALPLHPTRVKSENKRLCASLKVNPDANGEQSDQALDEAEYSLLVDDDKASSSGESISSANDDSFHTSTKHLGRPARTSATVRESRKRHSERTSGASRALAQTGKELGTDPEPSPASSTQSRGAGSTRPGSSHAVEHEESRRARRMSCDDAAKAKEKLAAKLRSAAKDVLRVQRALTELQDLLGES